MLHSLKDNLQMQAFPPVAAHHQLPPWKDFAGPFQTWNKNSKGYNIDSVCLILSCYCPEVLL